MAVAALVVVAVAMTGAALAFLQWRAQKLALLEPARLGGGIVWAGDTGARCRLVLVGDSRIAEWPLDPPAGWRFGRIGYPGAGSRNIATSAAPLLRAARPDIVAIQMGGNDAVAASLRMGGRSPVMAQAHGHIESVVASARAAGARKAVVLTLAPPVARGWHARNLLAGRIAGGMADLSRRIVAGSARGGYEVLDTVAIFRGSTHDLYRDWIHWNARGYTAIDNALRSALTEAACAR